MGNEGIVGEDMVLNRADTLFAGAPGQVEGIAKESVTEASLVTAMKPIGEKDTFSKGELPLHGPNAAETVQALEAHGTPVEGYTTVPTGPEVPPPAQGVSRILIVVPILEVSYKFFRSFLKFWEQMIEHVRIYDKTGRQIGIKYEIGYEFIHRKPVHISETKGVNIARFNKCTHVLFMDDDIYDIKPEYVDMLLQADKDVIAGVMYTSGHPYSECTFRRYNLDSTVSAQPVNKGLFRLYEVPAWCPHCIKEGVTTNFNKNFTIKWCPVCGKELKDFAIQPVDLIPFCFTLMKTSVFDRIARPWFHCNDFFPTDSWFADRCIEAGIQQYAHMLIRLNHRGITDQTRSYRYNEDLAIRAQEGQAVSISPQDMQRHQAMLEERMEYAEKQYMLKESPKFLSDGPKVLTTRTRKFRKPKAKNPLPEVTPTPIPEEKEKSHDQAS